MSKLNGGKRSYDQNLISTTSHDRLPQDFVATNLHLPERENNELKRTIAQDQQGFQDSSGATQEIALPRTQDQRKYEKVADAMWRATGYYCQKYAPPRADNYELKYIREEGLAALQRSDIAAQLVKNGIGLYEFAEILLEEESPIFWGDLQKLLLTEAIDMLTERGEHGAARVFARAIG